MKKILVTLLVLVAAFGSGFAQKDAFTVEVERMYNLTNLDKMTIDNIYTELKSSFDSLGDEKLREMCNEIGATLRPYMLQTMDKACRAVYTLQDMKNINAFYASPSGQKSLNNGDLIQSITTESLSSPEITSALQQVIIKYL